MKLERMFSSVVLPAPVPPETMMFSRQRDGGLQEVAASAAVSDSRPTRSCAPSRSVRKRRIDSAAPSSASGGMIALTREPSARRASTIGLDSSMRRPTELTMRSMICSRCRSSLNVDVGRLRAVPFALDVDLIEAVHQDVGDRRVAQQRFERTETEQLVEDVGDQALALEEAERRRVALSRSSMPTISARISGSASSRLISREPLEIEPVQQILMDAALELLVVRVASVARERGRGSRVATEVIASRSFVMVAGYASPGQQSVRPARAARSDFFVSTPARSRANAVNDADSSLWLSSASGRPLFMAWSARR